MTGTGWLIRGRVEKIPPELEVGWEGVGGKTPSFQFISTWWDLTLALLFCTQFWSQVSDVLWPYVQGRENMLICFFISTNDCPEEPKWEFWHLSFPHFASHKIWISKTYIQFSVTKITNMILYGYISVFDWKGYKHWQARSLSRYRLFSRNQWNRKLTIFHTFQWRKHKVSIL